MIFIDLVMKYESMKKVFINGLFGWNVCGWFIDV